LRFRIWRQQHDPEVCDIADAELSAKSLLRCVPELIFSCDEGVMPFETLGRTLNQEPLITKDNGANRRPHQAAGRTAANKRSSVLISETFAGAVEVRKG
jgi:hypothetical protein